MPCGRAHRRRVLERLGEPGFQELAQLGCRLELRNGIEFLECGSERIRTTRYRPRPEFLVIERSFVEVRRRTSSHGVLCQRRKYGPNHLLHLPQIQPGMENPHPLRIYTA